jgi:ribose 5-phosphate isomerase B
MKVVFASDHAGYSLKESLKSFVESLGHEVVDVGAQEYNPDDDYPAYCAEAARTVAREPETTRAILLGGSGQGEAMVANRFRGVRAVVYNGESRGALYNELDEIALSRQHNDANILSLGARFMVVEEAKDAVKRWLETPFSGEERHRRRIANIDTEAERNTAS